MTNREKYIAIFKKALEIKDDNFQYVTADNLKNWDSVTHLELVLALEEAFGINLNPEEILSLNSFESGLEVLKKHDVQF